MMHVNAHILYDRTVLIKKFSRDGELEELLYVVRSNTDDRTWRIEFKTLLPTIIETT
jgi:hypothetical protein